MQLPRWRCHKEVDGFQIAGIEAGHEPGKFKLISYDSKELYVFVDQEYMNRTNAKAGGFYVRYLDGYESFSPHQPFVDGYTRITVAPGEG
jgi:hypothetical protein